jgi:hypothetical protein
METLINILSGQDLKSSPPQIQSRRTKSFHAAFEILLFNVQIAYAERQQHSDSETLFGPSLGPNSFGSQLYDYIFTDQ